ncbi:Orange carotenoid protein [Cylindrospermum stagnale PCC 7417]|uniref:Orange carotenoid protein n=1 Tax=Cylindrospermum stagnale PCC 7417 TaxID=56107 RepID=K9WWT6_9NOST|nr:orange carotenoid protein N-terminal domain-containing protein [Cylindrospermum stagnale]AFZ24658.1 Orange carotenoid protein [Cylindrospermum stagnale PCC 7417]
MTATNINAVRQAVSAFHELQEDEQLTVLGLIYAENADTIPADAIDSLPIETAGDLVAQIQQLSPEEQLYALGDLLSANRNDQDEVMLDPHPSKALVELTRGGTKIPTGEYGSLSAEAKLAFWYLIGERLGTTIIGIPRDYSPSESATELLNTLKSLNTNDLVTFLKQVL